MFNMTHHDLIHPRRFSHAQIAKIVVGKWAYFMTSPADAPRLKMRDQCTLAAKTLTTRCRRFLTLGAEYAERETFKRKRADDAKPFQFPKGYGDTAEAKRYHARRVAEFRAVQQWQYREAA